MNKGSTSNKKKKLELDWSLLIKEWFPMIIALGLIIISAIYLNLRKEGFPDVRILPILLMMIAAVITVLRDRSRHIAIADSMKYIITAVIFSAIVWFIK